RKWAVFPGTKQQAAARALDHDIMPCCQYCNSIAQHNTPVCLLICRCLRLPARAYRTILSPSLPAPIEWLLVVRIRCDIRNRREAEADGDLGGGVILATYQLPNGSQ
ncbi:unnamed protein product, partial [Laminaria digitata]